MTRFAYVDSSCLVAVTFGGRDAGRLAVRLGRYDRLLSSNLLESELRSVLVREQVAGGDAEAVLSWITWVHPDRALSAELRRVAAAGALGGSRMWHLAHALYLAPNGKGLDFLTLDPHQQKIASALGFSRPELGSAKRLESRSGR